MKIAYLTQPYPPMISGASIVAGQLAQEMAKRGHEALVIAASDRKYEYTQMAGNLTVIRLKSIHNPLRVGQRVLIASRACILEALQTFQPDVIHTHEPLQMGAIGLTYAKQARIPIALTVHQLPWFAASYLPDKFFIRELAEALLWRYAGWILKRFTSVIAPSKTIARIIKSKAKVKSKTIPFGIDLETFHPCGNFDEDSAVRARYGLPHDAPIILHVGRLDADKLAERAVFAASKAMRHTHAILLMVGDGKQKTRLMELCRSLGIESRSHFTGFITDKESLAQIYRTASLFITASEIETQGIVILEAAACGLPIVAVKAACIPEIVQHEINGLLAAAGDNDAMSQAIEKILTDGAVAKDMGIKSRDIAEKYNLETAFTRHERFYAQLVRQWARRTDASGKPVPSSFEKMPRSSLGHPWVE